MQLTALHVNGKGWLLRRIDVSDDPQIPLGLLQSWSGQPNITQG